MMFFRPKPRKMLFNLPQMKIKGMLVPKIIIEGAFYV